MFRDANKGTSKLLMQDGDPSQNSSLARSAWQEIGAQLMSLPPRSGDIHCIESIFHIVKNNLWDDALKKNITYEQVFPDFCKRVEDTIRSPDKKIIDKMIETMQKRIELVIQRKGQRTKY